MLGHKTNLNKFKIEIISSIISNHSGMKLEINCSKTGKFTSMWRLNNMLLNNQWITEEIERKITNILRQMKMETQHTQTYVMPQV